MLTNTRLIRVQWGDCDPAGIVFYPRYFEWFDACSILLFEKATGMIERKCWRSMAWPASPLLEARAVFKVASHYGRTLRSKPASPSSAARAFSCITRSPRWLLLALEGFETRLWTVRDPQDGDKMRSAPMPAEIRAALEST
jgi:4-hydroxybenzoyl-CoA thioesterase